METKKIAMGQYVLLVTAIGSLLVGCTTPAESSPETSTTQNEVSASTSTQTSSNDTANNPEPVAWEWVVQLEFNHISPFRDGIAVVLRGSYPGSQWGVIDDTGQVVIEPQFTSFDNMHVFHGTEWPLEFFAVANAEGRWGVIDRQGSTVIAFDYDHVSMAGPYAIASFHSFDERGNWSGQMGVIDPRTGETILPVEFAVVNPRLDLGFFYANRAGWHTGTSGLITTTGEVVLDFVYHSISLPSEQSDLTSFTQIHPETYQRWAGVIDLNTLETHALQVAQSITVLSDNLLAVGMGSDEWGEATHWGLMTLDEQWILYPMYERIYRTGDHILVQSGHHWDESQSFGLVCALTGAILIPTGHYQRVSPVSQNLAIVAHNRATPEPGTSSNILDLRTGERLLAWGVYDQIFQGWQLDLATTIVGQSQEARMGVINVLTGETIVPPRYDSTSLVGNQLVAAARGGMWCENWHSFRHSEWLLYNTQGELLLEGLAEVRLLSDNLLAVGEGIAGFDADTATDWPAGTGPNHHFFRGTWGVVDSRGQWVQPFMFSQIGWLTDDMQSVRVGGEWQPIGYGGYQLMGGTMGVLDSEGQFLVAPELPFENISFFDPTTGLMVVQNAGRLGVIRLI